MSVQWLNSQYLLLREVKLWGKECRIALDDEAQRKQADPRPACLEFGLPRIGQLE